MREAIAAVLLIAAAARAGVPDAHAAARRTLVEQLDALATWCMKSKLFLDRNLAYELILRFDPDHREARKWLKYVEREGQWVRLADYAPPKNMNAKAEPAYADRRAEIVKQFADGLVATLEGEGAGWAEADRRRAIEDVLAVDPDNERARALNGQVRDRGRWVLAGTARAATRRKELVDAARAAMAAVPEPRSVGIGQDAQLGVAWTDAVETETWRVVATTGTEEARRAAVIATAANPLFEAAFGIAVEPRKGQVYYVMQHQADFQQVLTNHPRCTPEFRKFAFEVSSAWLPRTAILLAHGTEASTRIEYAARQPLAGLLLRGFGITARQGWAYEGIGLYLTELLTGTHTTYTIHPTGYAPDHQREKTELWNRIRAPDSNWFDVARQLAGEGKAPDLVDLMSKDVNTMDAEDLIFSYALAGYLIEARADVAPDLLRAIGEKKIPFHDAVPKVLGLDVRALEQRFRTWLGERR